VVRNFGHPLQLWGWGELKENHGQWTAFRLEVVESEADQAGQAECVIGGAQVLIRKLPFPLRPIAHIPRGPVGHISRMGDVLPALTQWVKVNSCAALLKIEPQWPSSEFEKFSHQLDTQWTHSDDTIFIPDTVALDLHLESDELLQKMTRTTRYNVRKSERECIVRLVDLVQEPEMLEEILQIYAQTSNRANFGIHLDKYYQDLAQFIVGDNSAVYVACSRSAPEKAISFLWNIRTPSCEFELYGGMSSEGKKLRANYALKWFAITQAKGCGVRIYDMNGLVSDGVSNFKLSFIGNDWSAATKWVGTLDYPIRIWGYKLWKLANKLRKILRH
jgi:lipid II:glycine glycyltransferase (peptidoglycan interpeptide bridge formation enzyme)